MVGKAAVQLFPVTLFRRSFFRSVASAIVLTSTACATQAHASELLVKFRPQAGIATIHGALATVGARQVRVIPGLGVRVISIRAANLKRGLTSLEHDPDVRHVERDRLARPQETVPDDPFFPAGSLALGGGAWGWYQTHTTQAWDVTEGDPAVVIAILDTGLKPSALDFAGQVVSGWNVLKGTTDTTTEAGNHGTYVAGAAGLAINSTSGNAGYCPGCKLMPVQVGTDASASYSNIASGIIWAADHGARVENVSWAGASASTTLSEAVGYARSKGVVVFAAAGNANCECATYPAATPGVLGVAGVSNAREKAGDSNYGSWVALAAPEGDMTAWPSLNGAPGYAQVGGTSLAAPAAAGVAGLVLSARPSLSGAQLEQVLESSATALPFPVAHGEVDAMAALSSLGLLDPQLAGPPVNVVSPRVLVQTNGAYNNAPLSGTPQVGQVLVRGQGAWGGASPLTLSKVEWDRCEADGSACVPVGVSSSYPVQSADAGHALRVVVTFTDPDGPTAAASAPTLPVGGVEGPPPPPVNTAPPTISGTPQEGQALNASSGAWSGSPTGYAYQWQRCDGEASGCAAIAGATSASYLIGNADVSHTLRVTLTASNAGGFSTAASAATAVVAAAPTQTLTFKGSISLSRTAATFAASLGTGFTEAQLSFASRCAPLTLRLVSDTGTTLASASGASVLSLSQTLSSGSYDYVVSGSVRCLFTLVVRSPAP